MRDLEFLTTRPDFAGTLIYRYRSGILRTQVLAALRMIASKEGRDLHGCRRDDIYTIVSGGSFFDPVYWCDWSEWSSTHVSKTEIDVLLAWVVAKAGDRFALFVERGSSLLNEPRWAEVERSVGLVLDEEFVTRDTLKPALRQLQAATNLATGVDWLADPAFEASFGEFQGRKRRSLLELRHAFDERVAACTHPVSHAFLPEVYRELHPEMSRERAASALGNLRELIARRRAWALFDLIRALDERRTQHGWTAREVVGELYRVTTEIIQTPRLRERELKGGESVSKADLALWAALLLSRDERLRAIITADADGYRRRPNGLVTALEELGRDFLARADLSAESDRLAGAWSQLDAALSRLATDSSDALGSVRAKMVEALSRFLRRLQVDRAPWLPRLTWRVRRAVKEARAAKADRDRRKDEDEKREDAAEKARVCPNEAEGGQPELSNDGNDDPERYDSAMATDRDWRWINLSFATIVGHTKAVAALRERVLGARQGTGIILHGPRGVGKRTLARIYARAVLCERPTQAGEACKDCAECKGFISSLPLGYYELDTQKERDEDLARKLVRDLNNIPLSERRVVAILNADCYSNSAFDALLKTLEEPKTPITFILVASMLKKVRLSGQSRCELYRLRPLIAEEARAHIKAMLLGASPVIDERVLDVLVAEAGGRVRCMKAAVSEVAALPVPTMEFVRKALGKDWVEGVASYWRAALADEEPEPEALVPPAMKEAATCLGRMRMFLLAIRPQASAAARKPRSTEASFLHREGMFAEADELLTNRAASLGVSTEALWGELARYWMSTDHRSIEGLREAGQRTRSIVTKRFVSAAVGRGIGSSVP